MFGTVPIRFVCLALLLQGLVGCAVNPKPASQTEFSAYAANNIDRMIANQEPINGPIDLNEAMARALKYNLDLRVKQAQASLKNAKLGLAHHSLLPDVVFNSGYTGRDSYSASTSLDLLSNQLDTSPSTSQERHQYSRDLTLSWDILDFGLSYVKAQQAADEVLIASELQRSFTHRLLEEVRVYYWRATTYQRLIDRLKTLDARTSEALANSKKLSSESHVNRLVALNSERELVKVKQTIKDLEQDLVNAKTELARLMNLKPGTDFSLVLEKPAHDPLDIKLSLDDMMQIAVENRPELRQNYYEKRINIKQAQANVLGLLPSLRTYSSSNWNSNSFLLNNNWVSAGATVSWSLLKLFQYPAEKYVVESEAELLDRRALALSMSIVSQLYVSMIQYDFQLDKLQMAERYLSVQKRLTEQMRLEAQAKRVGEQQVILEEMNELIAEAKHDIAYADVQKAYGAVIASIGYEYQIPQDISLSVFDLADSLENDWSTISGYL